MAFTNPPVIKLVSDNVVRLSRDGDNDFGLAAGEQGVIGLHGNGTAAPVVLPAAFKPGAYANGLQEGVSLQDSIQVEIVPTGNVNPLPGYSVIKSGENASDFEITITNNGDAGAEDPDITFEIYIRFH